MRADCGTGLFGDQPCAGSRLETLAPGAVLLRGFIGAAEEAMMAALQQVIAAAPLRHMVTPGGFRISVAMTNCGHVGWLTDRTGYRYGTTDPESGRAWPAMPAAFLDLAQRAAAAGGFDGYVPDSCLINRYEPGARLSLHQDKDERDFSAPIVSVSLGLPAVFLFGGTHRRTRPLRYRLFHGDVVVWGGPARLAYHGVAPLVDGDHPVCGRQRFNLTFRKAL